MLLPIGSNIIIYWWILATVAMPLTKYLYHLNFKQPPDKSIGDFRFSYPIGFLHNFSHFIDPKNLHLNTHKLKYIFLIPYQISPRFCFSYPIGFLPNFDFSHI